jgi:hypothetical protein
VVERALVIVYLVVMVALAEAEAAHQDNQTLSLPMAKGEDLLLILEPTLK